MTDLTNHSIEERYCFCELAPLYALDLLNQTERAWVEQQLLDCPELGEELAQYETAVTAIPYGVELVPDNTSAIKGKLFDRLNLKLPADKPAVIPVTEPISTFVPFMAMRSGELNWRSGRVPKVEVAILHLDRERRERIGLLRAEPGMEYPPHTHGGTEEIYMLSGDLVLEGVTYYAGDYIRSALGSQHAPAYSHTGCMFFFRSSLEDEYPE
jgi:anti-sigma factor ChrR (cupin superfamily)